MATLIKIMVALVVICYLLSGIKTVMKCHDDLHHHLDQVEQQITGTSF